MPADGIAQDVERFIYEHIDSVEQLDVLLFLRQHREKGWSAAEVNSELRTNTASVANRLASLKALRLIEESDTKVGVYQYRPKSPEMERIVGDLAEAYKVRKHRVLELIFSPIKRARNFANAFVVGTNSKKDGDRDG